jgi:hypothetical protein
MTTRKSDPLEAPARLATQPSSGDATLDRAARLLQQLQAPPVMHPAVEARIDRSLAELPPATRRPARWPVLVTGVVVLLAGGAAVAKYNPEPVRRLMAIILPSPRPAPPAVRRRAPAPAPVVVSPPTPAREVAVSSGAPVVVSARPVRPRPRVAMAPPPAPALVPPSAPSALADESALLGRALAQLRREGNPAAALATLDEYEGRFPRGTMSFDAVAARVEALLKLGRTDAALERLEAVAPAVLAKSPALRVVRGELRARAGRLAAAVADFDGELERGPGRGDVFERALYGRGSCRARQGDVGGARQDLERYLQSFPQGRFAAEARQVLGR